MEIVRKDGSGGVDFSLFPIGCFFEYYGVIYLKIRPAATAENAYNCNTDVFATFDVEDKVTPLKAKVVIE